MSYKEYKDVKKSISNMGQKELSHYLSSIYKSGYEDGLKQPVSNEEQMDLVLVMVAIQSTEGVGEVLYKRIRDNIEKLCFGGGKDGR